MAEEEKEIIYKVVQYMTSKGRIIMEKTPLDASLPTEFYCVAAMVKTAHTARGPISQKVPVEVRVQARDAQEAFEYAPKAVEEYAKSIQKESRIITATSMPAFPKSNDLMGG